MVTPDDIASKSMKEAAAESAPAPTAAPPPTVPPAPAAWATPWAPAPAPPAPRRRRGVGVALVLVIALAAGRHLLSERGSTSPRPVVHAATVPPPQAPPAPKAVAPAAEAAPVPAPSAGPVVPEHEQPQVESGEEPMARAPAADGVQAAPPESPKSLAHDRPFVRLFDGSRWTVQVAATKDLAVASAERDRLAKRGLDVIMESALVRRESWQRILVGRYATRAEAERTIAGLREDGTASTPAAP
jgi:hypothetical protein